MCGKLKIEVNIMNELLEFLTSKEIIVVYIVAGVACLLCFAIYLVEKNNEKFRKRHNTRELNKLVDQIKEETNINGNVSIENYEKPVVEPMIVSSERVNDNAASVVELLESTAEMQKVVEIKNERTQTEVAGNINLQKETEEPIIIKNVQKTPEVLETENLEVMENVSKQEEVIDNNSIKEEIELQYTSIEPDQVTAKLELEKLTEELKKQEELEQPENIALTSYEESQEENAIISLEELVKKSKEMYAANELSQYADEGNEPISLQDLEKQMGDAKAPRYDEPFIIENVVPTEELEEVVEIAQESKKTVTLDDFKTVQTDTAPTSVATNKKFQSSPIISPIYGIERRDTTSGTDLELENTANYDKLDEEIKKTNEFLMTLKELQKKLD